MPSRRSKAAAMAQDLAKVSLQRDDGHLVVGLAGTWQISAHLPGTTAVEAALDGPLRPRASSSIRPPSRVGTAAF